MVLKYAGVLGHECKLSAVIAIANAVDLVPDQSAIGSLDDPIVNSEQIQLVKKAAEKNEWITCVETSLGGHLGWSMEWLSNTIIDYCHFLDHL